MLALCFPHYSTAAPQTLQPLCLLALVHTAERESGPSLEARRPRCSPGFVLSNSSIGTRRGTSPQRLPSFKLHLPTRLPTIVALDKQHIQASTAATFALLATSPCRHTLQREAPAPPLAAILQTYAIKPRGPSFGRRAMRNTTCCHYWQRPGGGAHATSPSCSIPWHPLHPLHLLPMEGPRHGPETMAQTTTDFCVDASHQL